MPTAALTDDMSQEMRTTAVEVLDNYFRAKDGNRPHLLDRVFVADARLEIRNDSAAISFPAQAIGRDAIADVLVRDFGRTYENVYSFYLARPGPKARTFACDWLVGMTEKATHTVRVGCGRYDWTFDGASSLATRLIITIAAMALLEPGAQPAVIGWLERLPHPWCSHTAILESAPEQPDLQPVLRCLSQR